MISSLSAQPGVFTLPKEGGTNPGWPLENQASECKAGELLKVGRYESAIQILHEAQVASEQRGDAILALILAAAHRICLAGNQCQTEAEWYWQAHKEANQREHELRQQLRTILDLIDGCGAPRAREVLSIVPTAEPNQPERDTPEPAEPLGLRQGLQSLPGRGPTPPSPEREAPASPVPLVDKEDQGGQAPPSLVVYCLGSLRVYNNHRFIEKWPGHKCKSIFKYLIGHRERPIHSEILMDLFWRDADPRAARRNLYQAIYNLRRALQAGGPEFAYILCEESCYYLNPKLTLWVDSEAFCTHYQTGQRVEREGRLHEAIREYELAENLYEGEFLAKDRYEDWLLDHRASLKRAYLDILDRLSQHYFDQQQFATCIAFCQKLLSEDNCHEDTHRRLMRCYLRQGQRHLALRQYHLCVEALEQELDVPPMPATVELYRQIRATSFNFQATGN
jgi:DNA-binding SARP family transcriptional activator